MSQKYKYTFTGSPFVDAGIAGMCVAAGVKHVADLDDAAINKAVSELSRLMASAEAFAPRVIGKKTTVFATSEMSVIFPNGVHANPSGKPSEKKARYSAKVQNKKDILLAGTGQVLGKCCVDGSPAAFRVGNDEFPLADSKGKRNFHPSHQEGQSVGAATALALEFFPLSVLRTGVNQGFFWFVHTADEEIAIACAQLTRKTMNDALAGGGKMGFYGDWDIATSSKDAAFVALIRDIVGSKGLKSDRLRASEYPITAYVFSNDNRGAEIAAHDLPHELFRFFLAFDRAEEAASRFQHEILRSEDASWKVGQSMMQGKPFVRACAIPAGKTSPAKLLGGWEVHSLYATEVLGMSGRFIQAIEAISERIIEHDDAKKLVLTLRSEGPLISLARLNKDGLLTSEEYQTLAPPSEADNNYSATAFFARDYLLAAIFARQNAEAGEKDFYLWPSTIEAAKDDKHPLIALTERVGAAIIAADRGKRAASELARVRRLMDLRVTFLDLVKRDFATWSDFVTLFPPEDTKRPPVYLVRDYLLAFLYDKLRGEDLPDAEPISDFGGIVNE